VRAIVLAYGTEAFHGVVGDLVGDGVAPEHVIVVHNPRRPGEAAPRPRVDGVQVLSLPVNGGYAPAMNAGIERALAQGADRMLLLTHDVQLEPGAVGELLDVAASADGYGVLGPRLRWRDGDRVANETYGGFWSPSGAVGHHYEPQRVPGEERIGACDFVDGSAMLINRELIDATGPLDERFFLYFEETELCLRARRAGLRVGCAVDAIVAQQGGQASRPGAFGYLFARNGLEFARLLSGLRSAPAQAAWQVRVLLPLRRIVRPSTPRAERRAAVARVFAALCGWVAFALRRWGPPPGWLPGLGDVTVKRER
jgi:GT2 family glycosyltransferase